MRVINSAQLSYAITCGFGFYSPDFQTLAKLPPGAVEAFLPPELGTGPTFVKSGYTFSMAGTWSSRAPATCNGLRPEPRTGLCGGRRSDGHRRSTGRFFGTNADGVIYEHNARSPRSCPNPPTFIGRTSIADRGSGVRGARGSRFDPMAIRGNRPLGLCLLPLTLTGFPEPANPEPPNPRTPDER